MKKIIVPLILIVLSATLTYFITDWSVSSVAEKAGAYRADLLETQIEFLRNNSVLRPITDLQGRPDLQKYLTEVNVLADWFFKNPAKQLWDKHPEANDPESIIKGYRLAAEEEGSAKRKAKGNLPIREECYELTRSIYDELKSGTYKALASDFQGSVRFDLHHVKLEGNKLKWVFVTWGGIGDLVYDGWVMRLFNAVDPEAVARYQKELESYKKKGKPPPPDLADPATLSDGESRSASKSPSLPIFDGSDYVPDFLPGVQINYFVSPSCMPDAERVEMKFRLKARAMSGQDQEMEFTFMLKADPSWKGSWDGVRSVEAAASY
ncbi:MAG: hypothetical protein JXR96_29205 [Deltaproteobacteria bacterium]|nr:hypothetical protein [Deltaproteobacteria bacterium]